MNKSKLQSSFVIILGLGSALGGCSAVPGEEEGAGSSATDVASEVDVDVDDVGQVGQAAITEVCPPGVPASINPGADQTIKEALDAVGVQIYMCTAKPNAGGYEWKFIAPQANLYDALGTFLGTHFIGPTWQAKNGSSIVAAKIAGETVDPTAIPWLLLGATSHSALTGRFSNVTQIQRLGTVGGNAPATVCDGTNVGTVYQSPYEARYVFYRTITTRPYQCKG